MSLLRKVELQKQSDERVYQAMAGGNPKAFEILYERYKQRMLYYFYRMLGNNEAQAQDFLHDIFCKIIQNPGLFDPNRKFSTWIFSVAHNMCKNEYRSRAIRCAESNSEHLDEIMDNPVVDTMSEKEQLVGKIFDLLNEFDDTHRTAFLLKYREGLQIAEIAQVLNLPTGTVKSRLHYTRCRLQEKLSKCMQQN